LLACHQQAFTYLGGWPQEVLYDNMKQVKLGPGRWNEAFVDFARHFGFTPKTCQPYRPRTKGKVERMVEYVKDNFLLGRTFTDLDDLNGQGRIWLDQTANVRVHATTGQRPVDLWPPGATHPLGFGGGLSVPGPGASHRQLGSFGPLSRQPVLRAAHLCRADRHRGRPAYQFPKCYQKHVSVIVLLHVSARVQFSLQAGFDERPDGHLDAGDLFVHETFRCFYQVLHHRRVETGDDLLDVGADGSRQVVGHGLTLRCAVAMMR
jgi:hypothetical protein